MAGENKTYVIVRFWLDKAAHDALKPPYLVNSFFMHVYPMRHVVTRKDGYLKLTDGTYVAPVSTAAKAVEDFEYVDSYSPKEEIEDVIDKYFRRAMAGGFSGDFTEDASKPLYKNGARVRKGASPATVRDNSDPDRVLEFSEVTDLRDSKKEVPDAAGLEAG